MTTQVWKATGLTCDHCAQSVSKNLLAIKDMEDVKIDVHPNEISTITTEGAREFTSAEIGFAMREAGRYSLTN